MRPRRNTLAHADRPLVDEVRAALHRVADPKRAPAMQAYMKSTMPFLGVPSSVLKREMSLLAKAHPPADFKAWEGTALALFREAAHREEWYAALNLAGRTRHRFEPAALPVFEEMVVTGAWWDVVDESARRVGDILAHHRAVVTPTILQWARDPVLWKRRVAIICQLGHRQETDLDLLCAAVEANLAGRDFFIRKAIGWALRDYAKHDMPWVVAYGTRLGAALSPLSRREALKYAPPDG
jgi:3-methyladenine DNA glycosylase AlkD